MSRRMREAFARGFFHHSGGQLKLSLSPITGDLVAHVELIRGSLSYG